MNIYQMLLMGVSMPFCFDEAGGEGGDAGAGGAGAGGSEGGEVSEGGAQPIGDNGAKTGMFSSGQGSEGGEGEGGSSPEGEKPEGGEPGQIDINKLLGEELSKDPNIEKMLKTDNPVQEMAKSLLEAQKQVGKPKVGVPGENATPEEKAAFNEALGVPKEPAGYEFAKPEGMADEDFNQEHADKWATLMHENNVPIEAANALRNQLFTENQEMQAAAHASLNEAMDKHFGDNKQLIAQQAGSLMEAAVPDAELRATIQAAIGDENSPAFAAALGFAVQHLKKTYGLSDENFGKEGMTGGMSEKEMRSEAQKLMSSDAYRDPMHKDHDATKSKVNDMYSQIGQMRDNSGKK